MRRMLVSLAARPRSSLANPAAMKQMRAVLVVSYSPRPLIRALMWRNRSRWRGSHGLVPLGLSDDEERRLAVGDAAHDDVDLVVDLLAASVITPLATFAGRPPRRSGYRHCLR
jgi:hypothetical protein